MTLDQQPTRRRRFQVGLRTIFVVMTVFAVVVGYYGNWIRQRRAVLGSRGVIGITETDVEQYAVPVGGVPTLVPTDPQPAPWPLSWFGEQGYIEVLFAEGTSEDDLARARVLFPEAQVDRD